MTKDECLNKILELLSVAQDSLYRKCLEYLDSGAVDYKSYENNYVLPRILFAAALKNLYPEYVPTLNPAWKKEFKNLAHF